MPKKAKIKIKFNSLELLRMVRGRDFKALCANDKVLEELKELNKIAYVFQKTPNTVSLDCSDEEVEEWKRLKNSIAAEDLIFFLHEALRVFGVKDEDSYSYSVSYYDADMEYERIVKPKLFKLLTPGSLVDTVTTRNRGASIKPSYSFEKKSRCNLEIKKGANIDYNIRLYVGKELVYNDEIIVYNIHPETANHLNNNYVSNSEKISIIKSWTISNNGILDSKVDISNLRFNLIDIAETFKCFTPKS